MNNILLAAPTRRLICGLEGGVALTGVTKTACFVDPTAPGALQNTGFVIQRPKESFKTKFLTKTEPGGLQARYFVDPTAINEYRCHLRKQTNRMTKISCELIRGRDAA